MLTEDLLGTTPVPTWLVRVPDDNADETLSADVIKLLVKIDRDLCGCSFRSVKLDRLHDVLRTGIDVTPTDSPIYAEFITKAIEYGGWPKVILALDSGQLDLTYREVSAFLPQVELAALTLHFPTVLKSIDGNKLWLSRLKEGDPRMESAYETHYARWIPGDPFKALKAIFLCARESDLPLLMATLTNGK